MKNVIVFITALALSSLLLVSCSVNGPTSPIADVNDSSVTLESQKSGNLTMTVVGGQVATQSISPIEQIGTATIIVEKKNGQQDTWYAKLHGLITSDPTAIPVILSHDLEVYKDAAYTQFVGNLHSEGDIAYPLAPPSPEGILPVIETVNIVSGTKNFKNVSSDSEIVVTGTLNLVTGQNQFEIISGTLIY